MIPVSLLRPLPCPLVGIVNAYSALGLLAALRKGGVLYFLHGLLKRHSLWINLVGLR